MSSHDCSIAESILHEKRYVDRYGFVSLEDYLGSDLSIVNGARCSFGGPRKSFEQDVGLIRFLCRNLHTSPFEQVSLRFEMRLPIFLYEVFTNFKEAKSLIFPVECFACFSSDISGDIEIAELSHKRYISLINDGATFLEAFSVLSRNIYIDMSWTIDLHNLFKILVYVYKYQSAFGLLVQYSDLIRHASNMVAPIASAAFEDYMLKSEFVPKDDLSRNVTGVVDREAISRLADEVGLSEGELRDLLAKIN